MIVPRMEVFDNLALYEHVKSNFGACQKMNFRQFASKSALYSQPGKG